MSKIYHIKPKNQTKPPKDPLWKYILVIALVIIFLLIRDHRIDLSGLYEMSWLQPPRLSKMQMVQEYLP